MTVSLGFAVLFLLSLGIPEIPGFPGEVYWAFAILILVTIRVFRKQTASMDIPAGIFPLWLLLLGAMTVVTVTSHSIGQSIQTVIRYLECFAVFVLFVSEEKSNRIHIDFIIRKTALAAFALFLFMAFLKFLRIELPANALIGHSGHHPVAYASILFVPFFAIGHASLPFLTIPTAVTILSGSRLAIFLLGIFLFILSIRSKYNSFRTYGILLGILVLSGVVITALSSFSFASRSRVKAGVPFFSVFVKEFSSDRLRLAYAGQSFEAIRRYPFTGYGPGTFGLISRRFQAGPGQYSRFAHSLPQEFLAENGSIVMIFFILLFGNVLLRAIHVIRSHVAAHSPIAWSLILISMYSLVDVGLNHLPYMIFYWALAGVLCSGIGKQFRISFLPFTLLFSIISAGAMVSLFHSGINTDRVRLLAAPYRKDLVLQWLSSPIGTRPNDSESLIPLLYANDPDVLIGRASNSKNIDLYVQSINNDQFNYSYWTRVFLADQSVGSARTPLFLCRFIRIHVPNALCDGFQTPKFQEYIESQAFIKSLDELYGYQGAATFLYMIGLSYHEATDDIDIPIIFWRMARDIAPNWGYFHLELASALWYWHNDRIEAERVLTLCMNSPISRKGCLITKGSADNLPHPGSLRGDILSIPRVSP